MSASLLERGIREGENPVALNQSPVDGGRRVELLGNAAQRAVVNSIEG